MKKKAKSDRSLFDRLSESYAPVVLWLDDLEEIVTRIGQPNTEMVIETEEYQFDSFAEISSYFSGTTQTSLKISTPYPSSAWLELTPMWAKLSVGAKGDNASGIFFDLDTLLKSRQRKLPWLYSFWFFIAILAILYVPNNWLPANAYDWLHIASLPLILWFFWVGFIRLRRHSVIHFESRAKARSFLQRNSDQLAVAVIAALIGALIGIAGTRIADNVYSAPASAHNQPDKVK